jgi:1-acyl-sn-glycerol-3-phosphate acyltransferase
MSERFLPITHVLTKWLIGMPLRYLFFRAEVEGLENIPPSGGAILVANHMSNFDPGLIGTTMKRRIRFMAKQELFVPGLAQLLYLHGDFPVRRLDRDTTAVRKAQEVVREGDILGMFPEGTRSKTASMNRAHPGTALIALRTGVPIIPAGITGTEKIQNLQTIILRRPRAKIVYGKPFHLERPERLRSADVEKATTTIMKKVAELLPESYRGVYGRVDDSTERERSLDAATTVAAPEE